MKNVTVDHFNSVHHLLSFYGWFYGFIEKRLNRFIVQMNFGDGMSHRVATNNPGRLLELMVPGRKAVCIPNPYGKTEGKDRVY